MDEGGDTNRRMNMRYGAKAILAGLLVLGLCGMGQAAPAGFATQKGNGITMDVPTTWQVMPKEFLAKLQERNPAGTLLMGAQGPDGGMPQLLVLEKDDPESAPDKIGAMSKAEVDAWCGTLRGNLKAKTGRDIPITCEKIKTASGEALFMQMTVPANEAEMVSMTWTVAGKGKSVSMTVMLPKALESKYAAPIKTMAESMKLGK